MFLMGRFGLLLALLFLIHFSHAAPVQDTVKRPGRVPRMQGCYYNAAHFDNGERIVTNEPCLNCTCVDSMLMCFLRVCPFVKPLGEECIEEKDKDDCCPKIWCPEVIKEKECDDPNHDHSKHDTPGCFLNDKYYPDGAMLPHDPNKPCEVCYCIRNSTSCVIQECELKVDGCSPVYKTGQCCPCRYNCTYEESTTVPPGFTVQDLSEGCTLADGKFVDDGEAVNSTNPCEHCYCMRNEVVCAIQECQAPGDNCKPLPPKSGQCCPDRYECPSLTATSEASSASFSTLFTTESVGVPSTSKKDSSVKTSSQKGIGITGASSLPSRFNPVDIKGVSQVTKSTESTITPLQETGKFSTEESKLIDETISEYTSGNNKERDSSITSDILPEDSFKSSTLPSNEFKEISEKQIYSEESTTEPQSFDVSVQNFTKDDTASSTYHGIEGVTQKTEVSASKDSSGIKGKPSKQGNDQDTPFVPPWFGIGNNYDVKIISAQTPDMEYFKDVSISYDNTYHTQKSELYSTQKTVEGPVTVGFSEVPEVYNKGVDSPFKLQIDDKKIDFKPTNATTAGHFGIRNHTHGVSGIKGIQQGSAYSETTGKLPQIKHVGVKGSQSGGYGIKGSQPSYPTRLRPILPVGAIPGESNRQTPNRKRPTIMAIPGEGVCRVGKKVYQNGQLMESTDVCKINCQCINSVAYCDDVVCEKPPQIGNCVRVQRPGQCCPRYECGVASSPQTDSSARTTTSVLETSKAPVSQDILTTEALPATSSTSPSLSSVITTKESSTENVTNEEIRTLMTETVTDPVKVSPAETTISSTDIYYEISKRPSEIESTSSASSVTDFDSSLVTNFSERTETSETHTAPQSDETSVMRETTHEFSAYPTVSEFSISKDTTFSLYETGKPSTILSTGLSATFTNNDSLISQTTSHSTTESTTLSTASDLISENISHSSISFDDINEYKTNASFAFESTEKEITLLDHITTSPISTTEIYSGALGSTKPEETSNIFTEATESVALTSEASEKLQQSTRKPVSANFSGAVSNEKNSAQFDTEKSSLEITTRLPEISFPTEKIEIDTDTLAVTAENPIALHSTSKESSKEETIFVHPSTTVLDESTAITSEEIRSSSTPVSSSGEKMTASDEENPLYISTSSSSDVAHSDTTISPKTATTQLSDVNLFTGKIEVDIDTLTKTVEKTISPVSASEEFSQEETTSYSESTTLQQSTTSSSEEILSFSTPVPFSPVGTKAPSKEVTGLHTSEATSTGEAQSDTALSSHKTSTQFSGVNLSTEKLDLDIHTTAKTAEKTVSHLSTSGEFPKEETTSTYSERTTLHQSTTGSSEEIIPSSTPVSFSPVVTNTASDEESRLPISTTSTGAPQADTTVSPHETTTGFSGVDISTGKLEAEINTTAKSEEKTVSPLSTLEFSKEKTSSVYTERTTLHQSTTGSSEEILSFSTPVPFSPVGTKATSNEVTGLHTSTASSTGEAQSDTALSSHKTSTQFSDVNLSTAKLDLDIHTTAKTAEKPVSHLSTSGEFPKEETTSTYSERTTLHQSTTGSSEEIISSSTPVSFSPVVTNTTSDEESRLPMSTTSTGAPQADTTVSSHKTTTGFSGVDISTGKIEAEIDTTSKSEEKTISPLSTLEFSKEETSSVYTERTTLHQSTTSSSEEILSFSTPVPFSPVGTKATSNEVTGLHTSTASSTGEAQSDTALSSHKTSTQFSDVNLSTEKLDVDIHTTAKSAEKPVSSLSTSGEFPKEETTYAYSDRTTSYQTTTSSSEEILSSSTPASSSPVGTISDEEISFYVSTASPTEATQSDTIILAQEPSTLFPEMNISTKRTDIDTNTTDITAEKSIVSFSTSKEFFKETSDYPETTTSYKSDITTSEEIMSPSTMDSFSPDGTKTTLVEETRLHISTTPSTDTAQPDTTVSYHETSTRFSDANLSTEKLDVDIHTTAKTAEKPVSSLSTSGEFPKEETTYAYSDRTTLYQSTSISSEEILSSSTPASSSSIGAISDEETRFNVLTASPTEATQSDTIILAQEPTTLFPEMNISTKMTDIDTNTTDITTEKSIFSFSTSQEFSKVTDGYPETTTSDKSDITTSEEIMSPSTMDSFSPVGTKTMPGEETRLHISTTSSTDTTQSDTTVSSHETSTRFSDAKLSTEEFDTDIHTTSKTAEKATSSISNSGEFSEEETSSAYSEKTSLYQSTTISSEEMLSSSIPISSSSVGSMITPDEETRSHTSTASPVHVVQSDTTILSQEITTLFTEVNPSTEKIEVDTDTMENTSIKTIDPLSVSKEFSKEETTSIYSDSTTDKSTEITSKEISSSSKPVSSTLFGTTTVFDEETHLHILTTSPTDLAQFETTASSQDLTTRFSDVKIATEKIKGDIDIKSNTSEKPTSLLSTLGDISKDKIAIIHQSTTISSEENQPSSIPVSSSSVETVSDKENVLHISTISPTVSVTSTGASSVFGQSETTKFTTDFDKLLVISTETSNASEASTELPESGKISTFSKAESFDTVSKDSGDLSSYSTTASATSSITENKILPSAYEEINKHATDEAAFFTSTEVIESTKLTSVSPTEKSTVTPTSEKYEEVFTESSLISEIIDISSKNSTIIATDKETLTPIVNKTSITESVIEISDDTPKYVNTSNLVPSETTTSIYENGSEYITQVKDFESAMSSSSVGEYEVPSEISSTILEEKIKLDEADSFKVKLTSFSSTTVSDFVRNITTKEQNALNLFTTQIPTEISSEEVNTSTKKETSISFIKPTLPSHTGESSKGDHGTEYPIISSTFDDTMQEGETVYFTTPTGDSEFSSISKDETKFNETDKLSTVSEKSTTLIEAFEPTKMTSLYEKNVSHIFEAETFSSLNETLPVEDLEYSEDKIESLIPTETFIFHNVSISPSTLHDLSSENISSTFGHTIMSHVIEDNSPLTTIKSDTTKYSDVTPVSTKGITEQFTKPKELTLSTETAYGIPVVMVSTHPSSPTETTISPPVSETTRQPVTDEIDVLAQFSTTENENAETLDIFSSDKKSNLSENFETSDEAIVNYTKISESYYSTPSLSTHTEIPSEKDSSSSDYADISSTTLDQTTYFSGSQGVSLSAFDVSHSSSKHHITDGALESKVSLSSVTSVTSTPSTKDSSETFFISTERPSEKYETTPTSSLTFDSTIRSFNGTINYPEVEETTNNFMSVPSNISSEIYEEDLTGTEASDITKITKPAEKDPSNITDKITYSTTSAIISPEELKVSTGDKIFESDSSPPKETLMSISTSTAITDESDDAKFDSSTTLLETRKSSITDSAVFSESEDSEIVFSKENTSIKPVIAIEKGSTLHYDTTTVTPEETALVSETTYATKGHDESPSVSDKIAFNETDETHSSFMTIFPTSRYSTEGISSSTLLDTTDSEALYTDLNETNLPHITFTTLKVHTAFPDTSDSTSDETSISTEVSNFSEKNKIKFDEYIASQNMTGAILPEETAFTTTNGTHASSNIATSPEISLTISSETVETYDNTSDTTEALIYEEKKPIHSATITEFAEEQVSAKDELSNTESTREEYIESIGSDVSKSTTFKELHTTIQLLPEKENLTATETDFSKTESISEKPFETTATHESVPSVSKHAYITTTPQGFTVVQSDKALFSTSTATVSDDALHHKSTTSVSDEISTTEISVGKEATTTEIEISEIGTISEFPEAQQYNNTGATELFEPQSSTKESIQTTESKESVTSVTNERYSSAASFSQAETDITDKTEEFSMKETVTDQAIKTTEFYSKEAQSITTVQPKVEIVTVTKSEEFPSETSPEKSTDLTILYESTSSTSKEKYSTKTPFVEADNITEVESVEYSKVKNISEESPETLLFTQTALTEENITVTNDELPKTEAVTEKYHETTILQKIPEYHESKYQISEGNSTSTILSEKEMSTIAETAKFSQTETIALNSTETYESTAISKERYSNITEVTEVENIIETGSDKFLEAQNTSLDFDKIAIYHNSTVVNLEDIDSTTSNLSLDETINVSKEEFSKSETMSVTESTISQKKALPQETTSLLSKEGYSTVTALPEIGNSTVTEIPKVKTVSINKDKVPLELTTTVSQEDSTTTVFSEVEKSSATENDEFSKVPYTIGTTYESVPTNLEDRYSTTKLGKNTTDIGKNTSAETEKFTETETEPEMFGETLVSRESTPMISENKYSTTIATLSDPEKVTFNETGLISDTESISKVPAEASELHETTPIISENLYFTKTDIPEAQTVTVTEKDPFSEPEILPEKSVQTTEFPQSTTANLVHSTIQNVHSTIQNVHSTIPKFPEIKNVTVTEGEEITETTSTDQSTVFLQDRHTTVITVFPEIENVTVTEGENNYGMETILHETTERTMDRENSKFSAEIFAPASPTIASTENEMGFFAETTLPSLEITSGSKEILNMTTVTESLNLASHSSEELDLSKETATAISVDITSTVQTTEFIPDTGKIKDELPDIASDITGSVLDALLTTRKEETTSDFDDISSIISSELNTASDTEKSKETYSETPDSHTNVVTIKSSTNLGMEVTPSAETTASSLTTSHFILNDDLHFIPDNITDKSTTEPDTDFNITKSETQSDVPNTTAKYFDHSSTTDYPITDYKRTYTSTVQISTTPEIVTHIPSSTLRQESEKPESTSSFLTTDDSAGDLGTTGIDTSTIDSLTSKAISLENAQISILNETVFSVDKDYISTNGPIQTETLLPQVDFAFNDTASFVYDDKTATSTEVYHTFNFDSTENDRDVTNFSDFKNVETDSQVTHVTSMEIAIKNFSISSDIDSTPVTKDAFEQKEEMKTGITKSTTSYSTGQYLTTVPTGNTDIITSSESPQDKIEEILDISATQQSKQDSEKISSVGTSELLKFSTEKYLETTSKVADITYSTSEEPEVGKDRHEFPGIPLEKDQHESNDISKTMASNESTEEYLTTTSVEEGTPYTATSEIFDSVKFSHKPIQMEETTTQKSDISTDLTFSFSTENNTTVFPVTQDELQLSTEKYFGAHVLSNKTKFPSRPVLISQELSEILQDGKGEEEGSSKKVWKTNQTLIGHKITQVKPELNMEITDVSKGELYSSTPFEDIVISTDSKTTEKFSQTISDLSRKTILESSTSPVTTLSSKIITDPVIIGTHHDTLIVGETLPPALMQSPENLISHIETSTHLGTSLLPKLTDLTSDKSTESESLLITDEYQKQQTKYLESSPSAFSYPTKESETDLTQMEEFKKETDTLDTDIITDKIYEILDNQNTTSDTFENNISTEIQFDLSTKDSVSTTPSFSEDSRSTPVPFSSVYTEKATDSSTVTVYQTKSNTESTQYSRTYNTTESIKTEKYSQETESSPGYSTDSSLSPTSVTSKVASETEDVQESTKEKIVSIFADTYSTDKTPVQNNDSSDSSIYSESEPITIHSTIPGVLDALQTTSGSVKPEAVYPTIILSQSTDSVSQSSYNFVNKTVDDSEEIRSKPLIILPSTETQSDLIVDSKTKIILGDKIPTSIGGKKTVTVESVETETVPSSTAYTSLQTNVSQGYDSVNTTTTSHTYEQSSLKTSSAPEYVPGTDDTFSEKQSTLLSNTYASEATPESVSTVKFTLTDIEMESSTDRTDPVFSTETPKYDPEIVTLLIQEQETLDTDLGFSTSVENLSQIDERTSSTTTPIEIYNDSSVTEKNYEGITESTRFQTESVDSTLPLTSYPAQNELNGISEEETEQYPKEISNTDYFTEQYTIDYDTLKENDTLGEQNVHTLQHKNITDSTSIKDFDVSKVSTDGILHVSTAAKFTESTTYSGSQFTSVSSEASSKTSIDAELSTADPNVLPTKQPLFSELPYTKHDIRSTELYSDIISSDNQSSPYSDSKTPLTTGNPELTTKVTIASETSSPTISNVAGEEITSVHEMQDIEADEIQISETSDKSNELISDSEYPKLKNTTMTEEKQPEQTSDIKTTSETSDISSEYITESNLSNDEFLTIAPTTMPEINGKESTTSRLETKFKPKPVTHIFQTTTINELSKTTVESTLDDEQTDEDNREKINPTIDIISTTFPSKDESKITHDTFITKPLISEDAMLKPLSSDDRNILSTKIPLTGLSNLFTGTDSFASTFASPEKELNFDVTFSVAEENVEDSVTAEETPVPSKHSTKLPTPSTVQTESPLTSDSKSSSVAYKEITPPTEFADETTMLKISTTQEIETVPTLEKSSYTLKVKSTFKPITLIRISGTTYDPKISTETKETHATDESSTPVLSDAETSTKPNEKLLEEIGLDINSGEILPSVNTTATKNIFEIGTSTYISDVSNRTAVTQAGVTSMLDTESEEIHNTEAQTIKQTESGIEPATDQTETSFNPLLTSDSSMFSFQTSSVDKSSTLFLTTLPTESSKEPVALVTKVSKVNVSFETTSQQPSSDLTADNSFSTRVEVTDILSADTTTFQKIIAPTVDPELKPFTKESHNTSDDFSTISGLAEKKKTSVINASTESPGILEVTGKIEESSTEKSAATQTIINIPESVDSLNSNLNGNNTHKMSDTTFKYVSTTSAYLSTSKKQEESFDVSTTPMVSFETEVTTSETHSDQSKTGITPETIDIVNDFDLHSTNFSEKVTEFNNNDVFDVPVETLNVSDTLEIFTVNDSRFDVKTDESHDFELSEMSNTSISDNLTSSTTDGSVLLTKVSTKGVYLTYNNTTYSDNKYFQTTESESDNDSYSPANEITLSDTSNITTVKPHEQSTISLTPMPEIVSTVTAVTENPTNVQTDLLSKSTFSSAEVVTDDYSLSITSFDTGEDTGDQDEISRITTYSPESGSSGDVERGQHASSTYKTIPTDNIHSTMSTLAMTEQSTYHDKVSSLSVIPGKTNQLEQVTTTRTADDIIYNFTAKYESDSKKFSISTTVKPLIVIEKLTTLPTPEEDFTYDVTSGFSKDQFTHDIQNNTDEVNIEMTTNPVFQDILPVISANTTRSEYPAFPIQNKTDIKVTTSTSKILDNRYHVTTEVSHYETSKYPYLSSPAPTWIPYTVPDDIVKVVTTMFPTSPTPVAYESHSATTKGSEKVPGHLQQSEDHDGVCYFEGGIYLSSEQIPRTDNCEFCFCFKGDVICLQQTCPPPIKGCYAIPIEGFCCPRFHCPVQQMWFNGPTTTTTTLVPYGKINQRVIQMPGCEIEGETYRLHEIVNSSSNSCRVCRCDYGGIMKCDPRACKPKETMIQQIAEAYTKKR